MTLTLTAANETIVLRIKGMRCEECAHKVVSSLDNNFAGNFAFETADKKWISWNGKKITDYDITPTDINTSLSTIHYQPSTLYDLQGRRVIKPSKGIYVKDNKTVYIK
jgi:hypothetical protein